MQVSSLLRLFLAGNPFRDKSPDKLDQFVTKFNQCTPVSFKHYWLPGPCLCLPPNDEKYSRKETHFMCSQKLSEGNFVIILRLTSYIHTFDM